ncbi:hypothetical protein C8034_v010551 [Colletotrichum sidae]|uniref:Uncharacterized protein n=1 Tax=Colletotrichum sidae TaxID=1347389 RepID=A0A4R8T192_9PEZI|nr:hypothetical protein C8034_v010551 [Colletotrichum sidae]
MLNPYNLNTNINLVKAVDNREDHSHLCKGLNELVLHEGDFAALPGPLKVAVAKFGLEILLIFSIIII